MDHPQHIPLRLLKPVTLATDSAGSGFFLPERRSEPPLIVTRWDDATYVMHLEGPHAFRYYQPAQNIGLRGLLVEAAEIHVDPASRHLSHEETGSGTLCLKGGKASLLGQSAGGRYLGLSEFPLWGSYPAGTSDVTARFARWKLVLSAGDRLFELWTHDTGGSAPIIL